MPLKSGHHRPASESPYKWRFTGGPNAECWLGLQGIRTCMAKDLNTFEVFLGAGGPDALPLTPLDPHILAARC